MRMLMFIGYVGFDDKIVGLDTTTFNDSNKISIRRV